MALGDNTNQNNNKIEAREAYSRVRFYNPNSSVDPCSFQINYLFGMMVGVFAPKTPDSQPESARYDYKNAGKIFINHMDALVLMHEVDLFLQDPMAYNNVGCVNNSGSLLSISNGVEFGITSPCLVLRKLDENGDIVYTYVYEFIGNRYSIRNFDADSKEYDKVYYALAELQMFRIALEEYVKASTNAMAYSMNDLNRYADNNNYERIQQIHDKLGIEKPNSKGGNNGGSTGGRAMFDNNPGRNTEPNTMSSVDDIKGLL